MADIGTTTPALDYLKTLRQWICWGDNSVDSAGKINKQPFPYGCTRSSDPTDPLLWASYDECVTWQQKRGLRGLGFAFSLEAGIIGVDFDHCVHDGVIDAEVLKIIIHLDSYTELSPSGTGVHVLIQARKPEWFTTSRVTLRGGITMEVYDSKRYFTVTGDHVADTPDVINEASSQLEDVIEKYRTTTTERMVQAVRSTVSIGEYHPKWIERFMENKVASAVNKISSAPDGTRHNTRRAEARAVGGYYQSCVRHGYNTMSETQIIDRLFDANPPRRENAVKELRTIRWGFECGLSAPIDLPPMRPQDAPTATKKTPTMPTSLSAVEGNSASPVSTSDTLDTDVAQLLHGEFTEKAVADFFAEKYAGDIKYAHLTNHWYVWNNAIWEMDSSGGIVYQMIMDVISYIDTDVCPYLDEKQRRAVRVKTQTHRFITGVISLVKNRSDVRVSPTDFDMHHDYKPVKNGVINLITGKLLPHDKKWMFTGMLDFDYTPDDAHPFLDKFLNTVFRGDEELIRYVQVASGYSLTGRTDSQAVFFCYGDAQNGKSVFVNKILAHIAGRKFSIETSVNALIENQFTSNGSNTEVVGLRTARLSTTAELPKGKRFNSDLVKKLVDGSPISAADKYEKKVTWNSITKLWFTGNHTPNMRDEDNGIWRRFKLIPFGHTITEAERIDDTEIMARIQQEEGAILAWMVRGAMAWYANGKKLPECSAVRSGIEELRKESDVVGSFINQVCDTDKDNELGMFVRKDLVWVLWQYWTKFNNEKASHNLTRIQFAKSMATRFKSGKAGENFYLGLQVRSDYISDLVGIAGSLPLALAPYTDITKITNRINSEVEVAGDDEPTPPPPPPTTPPTPTQSPMAIDPSIDPQSLHGKILALIRVHAMEGIWGIDVIERVGFGGQGEKVIDALYELQEKGFIKKRDAAWYPVLSQ